MTTRRSTNLDVPGGPPVPVRANVLDFFAPPRLPFTIPPIAVLIDGREAAQAGDREGRRAAREAKETAAVA